MVGASSPTKHTIIIFASSLFFLTNEGHALSPPSSKTRRDFLDGSVFSVASAATAAASLASASSVVTATPSNAIEAGKLSSSSPSLALSSTSSRPLSLPPLGLGAWAWGDPVFWGYNPKNDGELKQVFDYALAKNQAFFDTAELYGLGRSEELLGRFRREACTTKEEEERVLIASKFAPFPWRTKREDVVKACAASMKRLGGQPIDLYQIHFPNAYSNEDYWDGLADAHDQGLIRAVGVSNYGVDALRASHAKLAARGIPLATNQIQMSLLYRWPLDNGLLAACRDLGVRVLSYSPLALGFLTGKYRSDRLPRGPRAKIGARLFEDDGSGAYKELLEAMGEVASRHGEASLSQVAINWAIAKGTTPIPGARNLGQVQQNLASLDWSLTAEEERFLDGVSAKVTGFVTPEENPFPRKDINTGLVMYDS